MHGCVSRMVAWQTLRRVASVPNACEKFAFFRRTHISRSIIKIRAAKFTGALETELRVTRSRSNAKSRSNVNLLRLSNRLALAASPAFQGLRRQQRWSWRLKSRKESRQVRKEIYFAKICSRRPLGGVAHER